MAYVKTTSHVAISVQPNPTMETNRKLRCRVSTHALATIILGDAPAGPGLSPGRSYRPGRPVCHAIWERHGLWTGFRRLESW